MNNTLRISFSLKNTYRVNSILYSLKQIPLIRKALPEKLYGAGGLKTFANVIAAVWEIITAFGGKFLYFFLMIFLAATFYKDVPREQVFIHILFFLTLIGAVANTYMFDPSKDKYYAMFLMRMNAREYTLVNYTYAIGKVLTGFFVFGWIFGAIAGVPLWLCFLIPFFAAGCKVFVAAWCLRDYERTGKAANENVLGKFVWISIFLLLAAAYGLPALGMVIPVSLAAVIMLLAVVLGAFSVKKIYAFDHYREVYQEIITDWNQRMDTSKTLVRDSSRKAISADTSITSKRKGFEYLNELFIRRHQKILWKPAKRITFVCLCLLAGGLLGIYLSPEFSAGIRELLLKNLPLSVFFMYLINRGTGFTQALFMNCDHSLLTYSFYKQPRAVLKLFAIRLREIMKINLLPAVTIGFGLALLLWAAGGTDNVMNYLVIVISIPALSMFFSVHYLMLYYLLQPYNAGTELKSGTYSLIMWVTYFFCYLLLRLDISTMMFGIMTIVFCVLYCLIACILVYRIAPRTFRIRN